MLELLLVHHDLVEQLLATGEQLGELLPLGRRLIPLTQVALDVVWRLPGGPGRVGSRG